MACPACFSGFVHNGEPRGAIEQLALADGSSVGAYVSASPTPNAPMLLFFTDVFGMSFKNSQLLADTYAAAGFTVFVPDLFGGRPLAPTAMAFADAEGWARLATPFRLLLALPSIVPWFRTQGTEARLKPLALALATALRARASAAGVKLFAAGFCLGGRYSALVAGPLLGGAPLVDAAVMAHPSFLAAGEAAAVAAPALYCLVEKDMFSPADAAKAFAAQAAAARGGGAPAGRAIVYPGMSHGFAVRGGPSTDAMRCAAARRAVRSRAGRPSTLLTTAPSTHARAPCRAKCAQDVIDFFKALA